ncbi:hypothetical protein ABZ388_06910 [Micromonospora parva]|uniref:hypothetical protein n=1 Tax=Micromonospora parva TaxID=1464048 RepID=UPI0033D0E209
MNDYTAHDIHRLDQAYPDAVNTIDDLIGNPARTARLAEVGPEVFAAELTRDLAASAANPMSLAAWAAIATVQLMTAAKTWEEDTDAAWAKADELTAELAAVAAAIAPTVTITPTSDAARFLHNLYQDWVKTAHKRLEQVNELTAELAKADAQLIAANRRADGLAADLSSAVQGNTALANENARLRQQRDTQADIAKTRADVITDLTQVIEHVKQRCPNCAPGYDCERGIYTATEATR